MAGFKIINDKRSDVKKALSQQAINALEICGGKAETYAKRNINSQNAVDTGALRNSIAHKVDDSAGMVYIGTNMEYAPYIEYGTGVFYDGGGRKTPWVYKDKNGNWHKTKGQKARPYLKPAVADHEPEYRKIIEDALKK